MARKSTKEEKKEEKEVLFTDCVFCNATGLKNNTTLCPDCNGSGELEVND